MLSYRTSEPLTACNRKPFLSESYQPVEVLGETGNTAKKKYASVNVTDCTILTCCAFNMPPDEG